MSCECADQIDVQLREQGHRLLRSVVGTKAGGLAEVLLVASSPLGNRPLSIYKLRVSVIARFCPFCGVKA